MLTMALAIGSRQSSWRWSYGGKRQYSSGASSTPGRLGLSCRPTSPSRSSGSSSPTRQSVPSVKSPALHMTIPRTECAVRRESFSRLHTPTLLLSWGPKEVA